MEEDATVRACLVALEAYVAGDAQRRAALCVAPPHVGSVRAQQPQGGAAVVRRRDVRRTAAVVGFEARVA